MRSIVVYQASDGKSFLSDSAVPAALNKDKTWISDESMKESANMHLHMKQVGGAVYFFRCQNDGTGLHLAKVGCATVEDSAWRDAATKLVEGYLVTEKA